MPTCDVLRLEPSDWEQYRSIRLASLSDSPDAFGSTFDAENAQDEEHWKTRLQNADPSVNFPAVAVMNDVTIGIAWGRIEIVPQRIGHIYQMWVRPDSRGVGVGSAIMGSLIGWFDAKDIRSIYLGVTCGESPARRLYESFGFKPIDSPKPLRNGSTLNVQTMRLVLK